MFTHVLGDELLGLSVGWVFVCGVNRVKMRNWCKDGFSNEPSSPRPTQPVFVAVGGDGGGAPMVQKRCLLLLILFIGTSFEFLYYLFWGGGGSVGHSRRICVVSLGVGVLACSREQDRVCRAVELRRGGRGKATCSCARFWLRRSVKQFCSTRTSLLRS